MKAHTENLIDALREELKEYGEMLARLDQQQEAIFCRNSGDLLHATDSINAQVEMIAACRHEREQRQLEISRILALPSNAPFAALIQKLPGDIRPLVTALVDENNELLVRVQQRARQNHLLLSRSVELMQRLAASLLPGSEPATYGGSGRMHAHGTPKHSIYDAIG